MRPSFVLAVDLLSHTFISKFIFAFFGKQLGNKLSASCAYLLLLIVNASSQTFS